ncbi:IclR family transcriptional regulator [Saccharopolyspora hirsuta]|uniref:Glycerol operon regulatory protein n=1 Tax=Saccharopolyspora hirsuta TaxID=1837 RepID=A0A5M7C805_SACHI|nr:IclR family transcriptional regulator [Saccharopolyspora hirsuta]KAA5838152.1 IclR family transcriptional regulator [Saccharopolyspora hirsuta]
MARPAAAGSASEAAGVKSARRAIDLVEVFAAHPSWLSLSDLHVKTGFPRSSLHGLLRTLLDAGWLEADSSNTRYRLGARALICGTAYLDRDPAIRFATEALEELREQTGFTTHYARLVGNQVVYLETRESQRSTYLTSKIGRTLPAHATALGKALLAELTREEVAELFPDPLPALTENTLVSLEQLHEACATTRERGYAAEVEEGTPGIRCVAAVVPYRIPGTDAISCSMPIDQTTDAKARKTGELLTKVTADLAQRLRREGIR